MRHATEPDGGPHGSRECADLETWDLESIEGALRAALIDELELKPRHAFGPVHRISGRRVSPPLLNPGDSGPRESPERISQFKAAILVQAVLFDVDDTRSIWLGLGMLPSGSS